MEGIGAEVSHKIRCAIKAKFKELGIQVDDELPDYVMVMVANKRSKEQMDGDLQLFLGNDTSVFTTWLHQVLQKLQEVTVAKLGGLKRKSSDERRLLDEPKKKKKSKHDLDAKELKKKIKEEPEDRDYKKEKKDSDSDNDKEVSTHEAKSSKKQKGASKSLDVIQDKNKKQKEVSNDSSPNDEPLKKDSRSKSLSISSQVEDIEDEDCINIRTDGELLDTAEDASIEECSKKSKEKREELSKGGKKEVKNTPSYSPERSKEKHKSSSHNAVDKVSKKDKSSPKISSLTPPRTPPKADDKVVDARELLNRRKAAKQARSRSRSRSRDRDPRSPAKKRKEDERGAKIHQERGTHNKSREDDKESSIRRQRDEDRDRDRRGQRERESRSRRRDEWPQKLDRSEKRSKERKRESSADPPKHVLLDRPSKNKGDEPFKGRNSGQESPKRKEMEDGARRPSLVSRVVPRVQEPEEEAPGGVPSVVKVTPRPRRPPSQQPSTSLIMRAISEANKSLATVPQRPDSTQQARKAPVFTRLHRQLKRIPPEKIAVEIINPLAVQTGGLVEMKEDDARSVSPIPKDKSGRNMSPPSDHGNEEAVLSEPEVPPQKVTRTTSKEDEQNEDQQEKLAQLELDSEDAIELEPSQNLLSPEDIPDDVSEPQFVVTLSGFDPDGIFSHSEIDEDEEPLLTSTPDEVESPRPKREVSGSPGAVAVNHNNLIEVEILRSKSEKCKYWPACRLGDKCTYYHPTKPCKVFPNCKFGDACLYIHPQCKFNACCTRKDCVFAHTTAHSPSQPTAVAPKAKAMYATSAPPCKFFPNCNNAYCQFSHPARSCRFGTYCTKKDCPFEHGKVAPVDKLKWSRVSS